MDIEGEPRPGRRQDEIQGFFQNQARGVVADGSQVEFHPAQRPEVQRQEEEGNRNEHGFHQKPGGQRQDRKKMERPPVPGRGPPHLLRVAQNIAPYTEQKEETGEHVLPLGDPRDGFHAERVEGPDNAEQKSPPRLFAQRLEETEQKDGIDGVEQDVGEMESPRGIRRGPQKRDVAHVGDPEQGGIHGGMGRGERGMHGTQGESAGHHGVVRHVERIVQVEQLVAKRRGKLKERQNENQQGQPAGQMVLDGRPHVNELGWQRCRQAASRHSGRSRTPAGGARIDAGCS